MTPWTRGQPGIGWPWWGWWGKFSLLVAWSVKAGHPLGVSVGPVIHQDEPVRVECYAGSRGEETPRRFWNGNRWEELTVLDRWVSEDLRGRTRMRWFRVHLEGGTDGLIYHDEGLDGWFWRALDPRAVP